MSRFHVIALLALGLSIGAVAMGRTGWVIPVVAALAVLMGLGVALPQLSLFGPFICKGATNLRRIALTFDDGPDPRSTPALLDLLRDAGVPAAFFCVGEKVAASRELTARIVREGHLVENHSFSHSNATNFYGARRLERELARVQTVVAEAVGNPPTLFRPPMGLSNPNVFRAARAVGLKVVGWSVRSLDTITPDSARVVRRIERKLHPGAIVLLHDGNIPADRLVMTVSLLLRRLNEQGYEVVRLDKLLE